VSLQALVDGKQVGFLFLPDPEDPDSYVRKHGSEAFRALVDGAEPLSRYLIREFASRVDMDTPEGKAAFLKEAEALVKQIAAPNLGRTMRIAVAREAGMPVPEQRGAPASRVASPQPRRSPADGLEESVLRALVAQPALLPLVREAVALAPAGGRWDLIRELVEGIGDGTLAASPAAIFQHLEDSGRSAVVVALQKTLLDFGDTHDFESDLRGTIARLDQKMRRARREAIVNGVRTVGDLSEEARAIMSDARRS
jgi:DNA primase